MAKYANTTREQPRKRPPATTPEGRENQLVSMAMDLVEKRMLAGTASAQEVTHFLKLGSINAKLERENLEMDRDLKKAKTEAIQSQKRIEELYADAISALHVYAGSTGKETYD